MRDRSQFLKLKLQATLLRDAFACHQLGASLATGDSPADAKDELDALRWYRRGADMGDTDCQYDLGFMVLLGEGTVADQAEGLQWLAEAAQSGHSEAMRVLVDLYEDGNSGVSADADLAAHWKTVLADHLQGILRIKETTNVSWSGK